MAMPQCCYLAKGAKRPSHTTKTIKFDRIPFDPCNSIKRFDLCPFDQKNSGERKWVERNGSNLHRFGIGSNGLGSTLKKTLLGRQHIDFDPIPFDPIRPQSTRPKLFDQKGRPISFRPISFDPFHAIQKFDLFTATSKFCRIHLYNVVSVLL